ncbi:MAG: hypothetical protein ACLPYZ_12675 [Limisphaerales bacterium]
MAEFWALGVAPHFMSEHHQETVAIKPRILPRDFIDVCLGFPIGLLLVTLFFGVPALAAFLIARAFGVSIDLSLIAAFVAYCLFYGFFLLFMVRRLTVAPDGLHFHRVLGSPKFLAWERISSVVVAPRSEVVIRGWLWPPFPSREITPSLSALQHYRISWDGGFCYYPPARVEDFEQYVVSKIQTRSA